jgi:cytochrome P450
LCSFHCDLCLAFPPPQLGRNPQAQKKLRDELLSEFPNEDDVNYDKLLEHPYLDQVIYESLRINPPIVFSNRECSEDITIDTHKGKVFIEQGTRLFVPLLSIQNDPEYFHDPEKFIPERFDHGIKEYCDKGVLIPFSDGPRKCLGMRYALLQLKCAIYGIVRSFEISVDTERTASSLEIDAGEFLMNVKKGGMWLNFKPIKS